MYPCVLCTIAAVRSRRVDGAAVSGLAGIRLCDGRLPYVDTAGFEKKRQARDCQEEVVKSPSGWKSSCK